MNKKFFSPDNWFNYSMISKDRIQYLEKKTNKLFPKLYKKVVEKFNGGVPEISSFKFQQVNQFGSIDSFISLEGGHNFYPDLDKNYSELEHYIDHPPEGFPKGLLAFGGTGGGDFICFDYRKAPNTDNPPIVYWDHEAPEDESVYFLANNFDEFLDMLYEG